MVSFKITNITYDTYDEEAEKHQTQEDLGLPTEMVVQIELQGDEEEWEIYDLLTYQIENQGYGWLVESFDFDTESKSAEYEFRTICGWDACEGKEWCIHDSYDNCDHCGEMRGLQDLFGDVGTCDECLIPKRHDGSDYKTVLGACCECRSEDGSKGCDVCGHGFCENDCYEEHSEFHDSYYGAEGEDFRADDMKTTVRSLITWIRNKPNPNRYTDAPDDATQLPKGDYLITNTIDTYYNLNNKNPDKWVKEEVPFTYDGIRLKEGDIITLKGTSTLYYDMISNWEVCNYQYKNRKYEPSIDKNVIRGVRGIGPKALPDGSWEYLGKTPYAYDEWIAQPENRRKVADAMRMNISYLRDNEIQWKDKKEAEGLEFTDWANQETKHHGKTSLKDWADHEIKTHGGKMSFQDWAKHEDKSHIRRFGAGLSDTQHDAWGGTLWPHFCVLCGKKDSDRFRKGGLKQFYHGIIVGDRADEFPIGGPFKFAISTGTFCLDCVRPVNVDSKFTQEVSDGRTWDGLPRRKLRAFWPDSHGRVYGGPLELEIIPKKSAEEFGAEEDNSWIPGWGEGYLSEMGRWVIDGPIPNCDDVAISIYEQGYGKSEYAIKRVDYVFSISDELLEGDHPTPKIAKQLLKDSEKWLEHRGIDTRLAINGSCLWDAIFCIWVFPYDELKKSLMCDHSNGNWKEDVDLVGDNMALDVKCMDCGAKWSGSATLEEFGAEDYEKLEYIHNEGERHPKYGTTPIGDYKTWVVKEYPHTITKEQHDEILKLLDEHDPNENIFYMRYGDTMRIITPHGPLKASFLPTFSAEDEKEECPMCSEKIDFEEAYIELPHSLCDGCYDAVMEKRHDHAYSAESFATEGKFFVCDACEETLPLKLRNRSKKVAQEFGMGIGDICRPCVKRIKSYEEEVKKLNPPKTWADYYNAPTKGIDTFTKPFEESSLDSGTVKSIVVGLGIGALALIGYNKWK